MKSEQLTLFPELDSLPKRRGKQKNEPASLKHIGRRIRVKIVKARRRRNPAPPTSIRKPTAVGSPEEITLQVILFQQFSLFDEKITERIQNGFDIPLIAYKPDKFTMKEDATYPCFRLILQTDEGYRMGAVHHKYRETSMIDHVLNRKSMWSMAQDRWTWRSFEDADRVVRWLNLNCRDDDHECIWANGPYAGRPENVWCWIYDRGIFK